MIIMLKQFVCSYVYVFENSPDVVMIVEWLKSAVTPERYVPSTGAVVKVTQMLSPPDWQLHDFIILQAIV
jgi:hypothetical protein